MTDTRYHDLPSNETVVTYALQFYRISVQHACLRTNNSDIKPKHEEEEKKEHRD